MDNNVIRAVLAGIVYGVWPLLMNRSNLSGNFSSFVLTSIMMITVAPFAFKNVGNLSTVIWSFAVTAAVCAGIGTLLFNGMLATATPQEVGGLFVIMTVVQAAIPAVYSMIVSNEKIPLTQKSGFVLAIVSCVLLTMKGKA